MPLACPQRVVFWNFDFVNGRQTLETGVLMRMDSEAGDAGEFIPVGLLWSVNLIPGFGMGQPIGSRFQNLK
jgi:hypothetical protein